MGRLRLLRAERIPRGLLLVFETDADGVVREVSALVPRYGRLSTVLFPHSELASGESLGSDDADEALRSRARQFVAATDAILVLAEFRQETS